MLKGIESVGFAVVYELTAGRFKLLATVRLRGMTAKVISPDRAVRDLKSRPETRSGPMPSSKWPIHTIKATWTGFKDLRVNLDLSAVRRKNDALTFAIREDISR
jgi:hypothetical protein